MTYLPFMEEMIEYGGKAPARVVERMARTGHAIRCGEGWFPIVDELDRALASLDPEYCLFRVARTGGELVFDAEFSSHAPDERFFALVGAASERASRTCEVCGAAGEMATVGGLVEVLCAEHLAAAEEAERRHRGPPH